MSHDHTRHGTTSLFAGLKVANGKVHGRSYCRRHRHLESVAFLPFRWTQTTQRITRSIRNAALIYER